MLSSVLWSFLLLCPLFTFVLGSDITTFSDAKCRKSVSNLDAVNGYPDGVCTPFNLASNQLAFQIARLDEGCAVTLYGPNTTPESCSADLKIVADPATCYNSSWIYYSIDGCLKPTSSSIILPTVTPATSPSVISTTIATATATATSSVPPPAPKSSHTGVIIGGIVGGVSVFAIALGIILFYMRRRNKPLPPPPEYELSNEYARIEAPPYPEKVRTELYGHSARAEMGRNSIYVAPVELPGDATAGEDKKGLDPIVKAHMDR